MRLPSLLLAAAVSFLPITGAVAAGKSSGTLVWRVDSVTARIEGKRLDISVTGAVKSGGWTRAHLHVLPQKTAEGDTLFVEFLAMPPGPDAAVIQALLPVAAEAKVRLPRYATTKVTVRAQSNQVTASIIRRK